MRNSIIMVALKTKKVAKPVEGNPLKSIVSTDSMENNKNYHHKKRSLAVPVVTITNQNRCHDDKNRYILSPPNCPIKGVDCKEGEEGQITKKEIGKSHS